ncbi:MAG: glycosyltransferase family 2 protein [bacterium]
MAEKLLLSIIIPHYNGKELLENCLHSLEKAPYPNQQVIVADNDSTDGSVEFVQAKFPHVEIRQNAENLGYAGGCNAGMTLARGKYILFLNNDAMVAPACLEKLVQRCESDARIAACQPKILSRNNPNKFDYAGAAGGLIDIFGYPFAKGRIFDSIEYDTGQYDEGGGIFWASGTALLTRKSALEAVGYFDEDFFAHMEEIDLCWRLHLAGYRVAAAPEAVVYHSGAATLRSDSLQKAYLNHRNNLILLLKNYAMGSLLWVLPLRILFECLTLVFALVKGDFVRLRAVTWALLYVFTHLPKILRKRPLVQKLRKCRDAQVRSLMYRRSIVVDYFVKGIRTVEKLKLNLPS